MGLLLWTFNVHTADRDEVAPFWVWSSVEDGFQAAGVAVESLAFAVIDDLVKDLGRTERTVGRASYLLLAVSRRTSDPRRHKLTSNHLAPLGAGP
jgi:hypothetical protein